MFQRLFATEENASWTLLRLMLGVVFFAHGAQKMLGWFGGFGFHGTLRAFVHMGMPAALGLFVILTEFFGSLGLLTGFLTRIAALGVSALMLGAIAMVHASNGFFMNWMGNQKGEGFEFHLLVLAIAITLLVRGAGSYSVDRALTKRGADEVTARRPPGSGRTIADVRRAG